jgi:excisionase family DNA binding protein
MSKPSPIPPSLLTVKEVANRLTVSVQLVYRLVSDRELEHIRVGIGKGKILVEEAEVERFLRDREV